MPAETQFVSVVYKPIDLVGPDSNWKWFTVFAKEKGWQPARRRDDGIWVDADYDLVEPTHFVELSAPGA